MVPINTVLRITRSTDQLEPLVRVYCQGLGFKRLSAFENHLGFDGIIIGHLHQPYHLEFTHHRGTTVGRAPNLDSLLVFYLPEKPIWEETCCQMTDAGFVRVPSYNPFWDKSGATFENIDGNSRYML